MYLTALTVFIVSGVLISSVYVIVGNIVKKFVRHH